MRFLDSTRAEVTHMTATSHLVCPQCNSTNRVPKDRMCAKPICGKCHAPLLVAQPNSLGRFAFEAQVAKSDIPLVVDFWAPWCGPCLMMAKAFEKTSEDLHQKARFIKINTEEEQFLAGQHGIKNIPTLAIFSGGHEIARQAGAMSAPELLRWITSVVPELSI